MVFRFTSLTAATLRHFFLAVLITHLAVPQWALHAAQPPVNPVHTTDNVDEEVPEVDEVGRKLLDAVDHASSETARVAMTYAQRNIGKILGQWRRNKKTGLREKLGQIDLNFKPAHVPQGYPGRALIVTPGVADDGKNLVVLDLPGFDYTHEIELPEGVTLKEVLKNDERVYLLYSDNTRDIIDVPSLSHLMCETAVPLFELGPIDTFGHEIESMKLVKRRFVPADKSAPAQLARLDRHEATLAQAKKKASTELVAVLKENLDSMKLPPLLPELEARLIAELQSRELDLTPEVAKNKILNALQVAYVAQTPEGERVVGIDSREKVDLMIGLQTSIIMGLMNLASPDAQGLAKRLRGAQEPVLHAIAKVMNDTELLREYNQEGAFTTLSNIPVRRLKEIQGYAVGSLIKVLDARRNGLEDSVYDRFSVDALNADVDYFQTKFIPQVTAAAEQKQLLADRTVFKKMTDAVSNFHPVQRMNQLVTAMKWPLIAGTVLATPVAADYMLNHGQYVGMGLDVMASLWNQVVSISGSVWQNTVAQAAPVVGDLRLFGNTMFSNAIRIAMSFSVVAVAFAGYRMTQYSMHRLIAKLGIKYGFGKTMKPLHHIAASLTGRSAVIQAMRRGRFPMRMALPFLPQRIGGRPLPENHAEQGVLRRTWNKIVESKAGFVDRKNAEYTEKERKASLAGAAAIHVLAQQKNMPPLDLLKTIAGEPAPAPGEPDNRTPEQRADKNVSKELSRLALATIDIMDGSHGEEVGEALAVAPDEFTKTWALARAAAQHSVNTGATQSPGFLPYLRIVAMRHAMAKFATLGEETYNQIVNPEPNDVIASYIMRGFYWDTIFSVGTTSLVGTTADPSNPTSLVSQPNFYEPRTYLANGEPATAGSFMWTNQTMLICDLEQVFLHLGASAAVAYSTMTRTSDKYFDSARPAGEMDFDHEQTTRGAFRDTGALLKELFDWRKNNPFEAFGARSWKQCVTLAQGFFVIGMLLRLTEGLMNGQLIPSTEVLAGGEALSVYTSGVMDQMGKAAMGHLFFMSMAPFIYRWFWAVHQTTQEGLEKTIRGLGGEFDNLYLQLRASLEQKDMPAAKKAALQIVEIYDQRHRFISDELRAKLVQKEGQSDEEWLLDVLQVCVEKAAAPNKPNEKVSSGFVLLGGIVTSMLSMLLLMDSFDARKFWGDGSLSADDMVGEDANMAAVWAAERAAEFGFDPSTIFLPVSGVSRADSMPSVILKSLANIYALWVSGRVFNVGWDKGRMLLDDAMAKALGAHKTRSEDYAKERAKLQKRSEKAVTDLGRILGSEKIFGEREAANDAYSSLAACARELLIAPDPIAEHAK